jgi:hypothetical protein
MKHHIPPFMRIWKRKKKLQAETRTSSQLNPNQSVVALCTNFSCKLFIEASMVWTSVLINIWKHLQCYIELEYTTATQPLDLKRSNQARTRVFVLVNLYGSSCWAIHLWCLTLMLSVAALSQYFHGGCCRPVTMRCLSRHYPIPSLFTLQACRLRMKCKLIFHFKKNVCNLL